MDILWAWDSPGNEGTRNSWQGPVVTRSNSDRIADLKSAMTRAWCGAPNDCTETDTLEDIANDAFTFFYNGCSNRVSKAVSQLHGSTVPGHLEDNAWLITV